MIWRGWQTPFLRKATAKAGVQEESPLQSAISAQLGACGGHWGQREWGVAGLKVRGVRDAFPSG